MAAELNTVSSLVKLPINRHLMIHHKLLLEIMGWQWRGGILVREV